jgi:hypothetical protein
MQEKDFLLGLKEELHMAEIYSLLLTDPANPIEVFILKNGSSRRSKNTPQIAAMLNAHCVEGKTYEAIETEYHISKKCIAINLRNGIRTIMSYASDDLKARNIVLIH